MESSQAPLSVWQDPPINFNASFSSQRSIPREPREPRQPMAELSPAGVLERSNKRVIAQSNAQQKRQRVAKSSPPVKKPQKHASVLTRVQAIMWMLRHKHSLETWREQRFSLLQGQIWELDDDGVWWRPSNAVETAA